MEILYASREDHSLWPNDAATGNVEVERVSNVAGLEDRLGDGDIDCVVVDSAFPEGDPVSLLHSVREQQRDVPFVLYAEEVDEEIVAALYESPFTDYTVRAGRSGQLALAGRVSNLVAARDRSDDGDSTAAGAGASVTISPEGTISFASGAVDGLFGDGADTLSDRSADDHLPATFLEDVHDGSVRNGATVRTTVTRLDGTKQPVDVEVRRSSIGGRVTLEMRSVESSEPSAEGDRPSAEHEGPITDTDTDVTDAALSAPSQAIEEVLNRVTDAVFALDTEGRFTYLNERAEELLNRSEAELRGEWVLDVFEAARGSTFERESKRAIAEQERVSFTEYFPPLETWFEGRAYPSDTGLSVYFRDVTEEKQIADEQRMVQAITRDLADATSLDEGLESVVEHVVAETDWSYGEAWRIEDGDLVQTDAWRHAPVSPVADATSLSTIRSWLADLSADDDVVGRTLEGGDLIRHSLADAGLESAVTVPVINGDDPVAVLVFGLHATRENLDRLIGAVETASTELGSFVDRIESRADYRRRTRQFEAVFDDPVTYTLLLDDEGRITRTNNMAQSGFELFDFEWQGAYYWEYPWWDDATPGGETVRESVERALDGEYVHFETTTRETSVNWETFDVSMRPVFGEEADDGGQGTVEGVVVGGRDITERKRAAERAEVHERQFEAAFEDPTAGMLLLDEQGIIQRANDVAKQNAPNGMSLKGVPYWEHPWWDDADLDASQAREYVDRVAAGEYVRFETENESLRDRLVAYDVSLRPMVDDDEVVGMVSETRDVTAQRQLEQDLREERDLVQRILETSPVGIGIVARDGEVEFLNSRGEEILGERPASVPTGPDSLGDDGEPIPDSERPYRRVFAANEPITGMSMGLQVDGRMRWYSVSGAPLDDGDRAVMTFEEVTAQRQRTDQLTALAEVTQELSEVESAEAVAATAVRRASEVIGARAAAIALYDEEDDRLSLVPNSDESLGDHVAGTDVDFAGWQAFATGEAAVDGSVLALPLGSHGVLLARLEDEVTPNGHRMAELLTANVAAELARADREVALRDRTEELAARTTELERLDHINRTIRELTGGLLDAASRADVETITADSLADTDRYPLAWVATVEGESVDVTAHAGDRADAFAEAATGDETSPPVRAIRTGDVQVYADLLGDEGYPPWRDLAVERGVNACAAVPLVHQGTRYGVLVLYGRDAENFGNLEREVLAELGEMVGYAVASQERRLALVSDRSTEVELAFPAEEFYPFPFVRREGVALTVRDVVARENGRIHFFFDVDGISPETVLAETEPVDVVERITRVSPDRNRFEVLLSADTVIARLFDRGFAITGLQAAGGRLSVTVRAPTGADPRTVFDAFETEYDDLELVSKRGVEDPVWTDRSAELSLLDDLTNRQEEVLRTAHAAGFFEWPRVNSGQDVAEMLDVSQPTVNRHLRAVQRKLFDRLLEDETD